MLGSLRLHLLRGLGDLLKLGVASSSSVGPPRLGRIPTGSLDSM